MAVSQELLSDDIYRDMLRNQMWQNQLGSGLGIANAGWKTALGLALGTGLGNWLGYKFGNYQKERDDSSQYGKRKGTPQQNFPNIFNNGNYDLGWTPPPYQFLTAEEYIKDAPQVYNQNWRQNMINRALPVYWRPNLSTATVTATTSPTPQTLAPTTTTTATAPQQNFAWGYRPLTEGSLKPKPAMTMAGALDNVFPYYGLSRW